MAKSVDNLETLAQAQGFTAELVDRIARAHDEPDWLVERRREAFRIFSELPLPSWRHTRVDDLKLERLRPVAPASALPAWAEASLPPAAEAAAIAVQVDGRVEVTHLDPALAERGLVVTDLHTAARTHGELVQKYFMQSGLDAGADRFAALHAAFWTGGFFVYVPRGLVVEKPIYLVNLITGRAAGASVSGHGLVVLDEQAEATLFDESDAHDLAEAALYTGQLEIHVQPAARLNYVSFQNWRGPVREFSQKAGVVRRDATLLVTTGFFGGSQTRHQFFLDMVEPGASMEHILAYAAAGQQHFDLFTRSRHGAPSTFGNMTARGILTGSSRLVYQGLIRIDRGAHKSEDYLSSNTLILSPEAKVLDDIPSLEIEADDVKASHGATVGQIDQEQLFYLRSRGLDEKQARRLLVSGFFEPLLGKIPNEAAQERISELVLEKVV
ncbi:Fe-S cluster assembly protein SufD [Thermaerobacter sp. PB12/4term]|uniref:Fe-S cluster assembly protein SufD n=1 Tax=Thermaerobacter sp. PB12/4term TaxID=2293838 RepID=UPI000E32D02A|nr:Fe-S cluster assembly protein SufD [Thermaerobacter sp. PB12/4term]QIA26187.1 Fe-S cluster assembly protein SufD [Thermaerobacter sp. PB12/4term]